MKSLFLFIPLFALCLNVSAQFGLYEKQATYTHHAATYNVKWKAGTSNNQIEREGIYYLLLADGFSQFIAARAYYTDTLVAMGLFTATNYSKYLNPEIAANLPLGMYPNVVVYKHSNEIEALHEMSGGRYTYREKRPLLKWTISTDEKEVAGYSCQKATTHFAGRDYVAWFTSEIPYRDGPYKFSELPGFIVQVADKEGDYSFTLTSFEKVKRPIFKHKGAVGVKKQAYYVKEKAFFENYIKQTQAAGVSFPDEDDSSLKRKNQRVQQSYNPIERIVE